MNSDIKLMVESMLKLSDSMKGLREAVKRQETKLKTSGYEDIQLIPTKESSNDCRLISEEHLVSSLGPFFHGSESELSQVSHWSYNTEIVEENVRELKNVLKNKDKQLICMIAQTEELKNDIKKKDKELKRQKILLKAERENFEQYKKDTCNEVRKHKREEFQDIVEKKHKTSKEILKISSELTHYKQLYVAHAHTLDRLTKQVKWLKENNRQLKYKLMNQEDLSNKFILEMTQRFDISRKEMILTMSNKIDTYSSKKANQILYRIVERNARLAHDNCMLKKEMIDLKQKLTEKALNENIEDCLSLKKCFSSNLSNKVSGEFRRSNETKARTHKKNGLNIGLPNNYSSCILPWQPVLGTKTSSSAIPWDSATRLSDGSEYMGLKKSSSLPELNQVKKPYT